MDPSHGCRYSKREIELIALDVLKKEYPNKLSRPIDIDRIVYNHGGVDDIRPIPLLEDKFQVSAILYVKENGKADILVDEDTLDFQHTRASFSIAHEFGHIVLHKEVWSRCKTIEDSIALHRRINRSYKFIEGTANWFAGAILVPFPILGKDVREIYAGLVKIYGFDADLICHKMYSDLAKGYGVSPEAMRIRLSVLDIQKKIESALHYKSPYIGP
ncbi:MAG: ImmA/IrrE family metallo-endopeptidase [Sedimentisphaerales bacterium]|nr:ImmA/IrrE family metallo-endopeptidase [Sedimentisphaerales bacterium]